MSISEVADEIRRKGGVNGETRSLSDLRLRQATVLTIFLLLFVGDFFGYYFRTVAGLWMPPFGIIAYALATILFLLSLTKIPKTLLRGHAIVLGLFVSFLLWAVFAVYVSGQGEFSDYLLIGKYALYFFIGTQLYPLFRMKSLKTIVLLACIGIVLTIIANVDTNYRLYFGDTGVNYLRLAESLAFLGLVGMSLATSRFGQWMLYVISIGSLFLINSRAALYGFAFAGLVLYFLRNGYSRLVIVIIWTLILLLLIAPIVDIATLAETRVLRLLLAPEKDTSLAGRTGMMEAGWNSIKKKWFLGDFKGQMAYGGYGSYIHNGLSYWRQYGLVPFALLSVLVMVLGASYVLRWRRIFGRAEATWEQLSLAVFLYSVLLVVVAKSFVYLQIFLALGMSYAALSGGLREYRQLIRVYRRRARNDRGGDT